MRGRSPETFLKRKRIALFLLGMPLAYLDLILPAFGDGLGASVLQIGLLYTIFSCITIAARPAIGCLSDRMGRRIFILAGLFLYAAALFLLGAARSFAVLAAARAVQGLAAALFWISMDAAIAEVSEPRQRARNFGAASEASTRGQIAGCLAGFAIMFGCLRLVPGAAQAEGMRASFAFFGCALLAAAVYAAAALPETRPERGTTESGSFRLDSRWALVLAANFANACSLSLIAPLVMIILLQRFRAPLNIIALCYLPMGLVWAFAPKRCAGAIARFGKLPVMAASLMAASASAISVAFVPALWMLAGLWALTALFDVAGDIAGAACVADLSPRGRGGKGYGLYVMAGDVGSALGPLVGAYLYGFGAWLPFAAASAIFALSGAAVAAFGARAFSGRQGL